VEGRGKMNEGKGKRRGGRGRRVKGYGEERDVREAEDEGVVRESPVPPPTSKSWLRH